MGERVRATKPEKPSRKYKNATRLFLSQDSIDWDTGAEHSSNMLKGLGIVFDIFENGENQREEGKHAEPYRLVFEKEDPWGRDHRERLRMYALADKMIKRLIKEYREKMFKG